MLIPHRKNYGFPILLDLNLAVFIAMGLSGAEGLQIKPQDLLAWGANYGPYIHGLGIFRLISSQFVHAGIMHLANNMYGLFFASIFLSRVVRDARLILCYLVCGLGGSIASFVVHPMTVSVGASGAIMGLCGILLALVLLNDKRIVEIRKLVLVNVGIMTGLTLLLGLKPGIDNAAHLGGFITGAVLGLAISLFGLGEPFKASKPHAPT